MGQQIMHRQGDILFVKIEALPSQELTKRASNIIAEGEVTGHAHKLQTGSIWKNELEKIFINAEQGSHVVHEEHHTIVLEPGYWEVIRQREYTPQGIREVLD